jgi:hypothetical protein
MPDSPTVDFLKAFWKVFIRPRHFCKPGIRRRRLQVALLSISLSYFATATTSRVLAANMLAITVRSLALLCLAGLATTTNEHHWSHPPISKAINSTSTTTAFTTVSTSPLVVVTTFSTMTAIVVETVSRTTSEILTALSTRTFIAEALAPSAPARRVGPIPAFFRFCTGRPDGTGNPRCRGTCEDAVRMCDTTGRETENRIKTGHISCLETNTTVPFSVCDRKFKSCTDATKFHPGLNTLGMRVYNTPKTHYIDIHCHLGGNAEGGPAHVPVGRRELRKGEPKVEEEPQNTSQDIIEVPDQSDYPEWSAFAETGMA